MGFDQGWRVDQHVRFVRDVHGDGRADLIGFGNDGVYLGEAQGSGFATPTRVLQAFQNTTGWTPGSTIRTLADVNGDGRLDLVGFGATTVRVALKNAGAGYATPTDWITDFTTAQGWNTTQHVRMMADIDADGRADIVGIDDWGVYVSRARTNNTFEPKRMWLRQFSSTQGGWDTTKHLRVMADVNDDGRADLVGFGTGNVYVSLSTGTEFTPPAVAFSGLSFNQNWRVNTHVRVIAYVNNDRYPDIVGLGPNGAVVALGNGTSFAAPVSWLSDFDDVRGWVSSKHPRFVADVDGDGLDDLIGIKDDHVYVARSTGSAFAAPVSVSDEFTFNRGWQVDKHPRFVADIDGDGALELVGYFNDAVYWDRLVPAAEPPTTSWDAPTCSPSRLLAPNARSCEGPWAYTETSRCVSQDNACPTYCPNFQSCEKWENGAAREPASGSLRTDPTEQGTGARHCTQDCNSQSCFAEVCQGTITQPTAACNANATDHRNQIKAALADAIRSENTFDSSAAQEQVVSQAQALVTVTPNHHKVRTNQQSTTPGPGGVFVKSWDEHWECDLDVVTATPVLAENSACGCEVAPVHSVCEHNCGTTAKYTAPGATRPVSPYIAGQVCMTSDDLPATTPTEVQTKFERLWTSYQGPTPPTVTDAVFRSALVKRLKLAYELWGEQLTNQGQPTDQVHRAMALYQTRPSDSPACMESVDDPSSLACTAPSVTGTHGDLIRCERLVGPHASSGVASIALAGCLQVMNGYLDLAANSSADASCLGPRLRRDGAMATFQLADKQLQLAGSPGPLGSLPRQLWLLDSWVQASRRADGLGTFPAPDQQRRDTSFLIGRLWDGVRAAGAVDDPLRNLPEDPTLEQVEAALGVTAVRGRQSEQAVITALFQVPGVIQPENVSLTRPPLRGLPVLALLADGLKPLVDDLDGLAVYHDIACQFRDCRTPVTSTPTRNAWNILSSLEATPGLGNAVNATPQPLASWKTVFGVVASHQEVLTQAVAEAVTGPGGLAGATREEDVQPLARPLWTLYQHARAFHDHYETTGLFEPTAQNQLHGSLLQESQDDVVNGLRSRVNGLGEAVNSYKAGLIAAVQTQIALLDTGAQTQNLQDQRLRKAEEMKQKGDNLEGLRVGGEDEDAAFGSLAASFADVQGAIDEGAFVQVGDTQNFTLTGNDAHFTSSADPATIATHTVPNLARGQMLVIQTSGLWAPTCSLREVNFLGADGQSSLPANLAHAEIGPEGYTITSNESSYEAHSAGHGRTREETVGTSIKYCETAGALTVLGPDPSVCVYGDIHVTWSRSTNDSNGSEARASASFASGLRLPNTPFPKAPVGSLLVVLTDPQTGAIRDVRVVRSGSTSILIEANSHAYFVVNDKRCATPTTTPAMTVTVRPVTSALPVAQAALTAMANVLDNLRNQQDFLARQGALLPTQATLLRQQANLALQAQLDQIAVASLPPPLASLFDAFVSHEIVATERKIEIRAIERSLDLDLIDMRTIDDELRAGATRARLQRLVPRWIVRDLDHDRLRHNLLDTLSVTRDFLKPIIDLWYPHALDDLQLGRDVDDLLNADVDSSLVTLATAGTNFVNSLLGAYDDEQFGAKPSGPQLPVVVVTFPRPGASTADTPWRMVDEIRSRRVWDAIDAHEVAHFEITPDDFYSRNGGDAVLSCNEVVPVIKTMGLYVTRPGSDISNQTLNGLGRQFAGLAGQTQSFVALDGPRVYQLANAVWGHYDVPIRYGENEAALTTFLSAIRQTRPVGLSPTGAFDLDFSILDTLPPASSGLAPDDPTPATAVSLMLELDSRAVASRPTWVNRCR